MEGEVTMILIDSSDNVPVDSDVFKTQLEAIRLYCRAKIKSNSKIRVGAATTTMGYGIAASQWPNPSDVEHFLTHTLEHIPWGGQYDILGSLHCCKLGFARLPEATKRRMLVFLAGPCHGYLTDCLLKIGKRLKETNIALDVVSFAHEDQEFDKLKTKCLRSFVAAANNKDNNSHFARVPRDSSSVCDILVSSKILSRSEVAQEEMNKETSNDDNKKKRRRSRSRRKKNHHSQDLVKEAVSSCRDVIFPHNLPVSPGWLVFGSLEMYQLIKVFGSLEMYQLIKVQQL